MNPLLNYYENYLKTYIPPQTRRGYIKPSYKYSSEKKKYEKNTIDKLFDEFDNKDPSEKKLTRNFITKIDNEKNKFNNPEYIENIIKNKITEYYEKKERKNEEKINIFLQETEDAKIKEVKKRGRPKKEVKEVKEVKKRGRPKKEVKEVKKRGRPKKEVKIPEGFEDMPPLEFEPRSKIKKNLENCLYKYPVRMLNQFRIDFNIDNKGWYKLNKDEKIDKLKVEIKNCDDLPPVPVRIYREKEYGVKAGNIRKYTEEEQKNFLAVNYDNVHPLISKRLDKIKNKRAYEQNVNIVLNKHQRDAVKHFIDPYFKGGLFFHSVGSGKSLTSVVLSHYYLSLYPTHKVVVITPPSLLFNFIDAMRLFGLDVKDNRYTFQTFQKFAKNYTAYVDDKTLLIIDEVHILRTEKKDGVEIDETGVSKTIIKKGRLPNTIIEACSMCDKVLCMTGTAFVNELYDIENIMSMINGGIPAIDRGTFNNIINSVSLTQDYFKHKISYYNIFETDLKKYFPTVNTIYVGLKLEGAFNNIYKSVLLQSSPYKNINEYDDLKEEKMQYGEDGKGRLETITTEYKKPEMDEYGRLGFRIVNNERLKKGEEKDEDFDKDTDRGRELKGFYVYQRQYANIINGEKINFIIKKIKDNPNKQSIIYSSFIQSSLGILIKKMRENKILFTTITGEDPITRRKKAVVDYNDAVYQVLIISRAGTEGVDTKNTQQFFLFEPQWNRASEEQAIARAVRFKSHISLPEKERYVNVYRLIVFTEEDEMYFNRLKNGEVDDFLKKQKDKHTERKFTFDKIKKAIKKTKYDYGEEYYKDYFKEKNKKGRGFNATKPTVLQIKEDYLYYLLGLKEFKNFSKEFEEKELDTNYNINIYPKSADLILEYNSTAKQATIDNFLKYFKKEIPKIEDYNDEFHTKLIRVLEDEKNPEELLKKQRDLLKTAVNRTIKFSEDTMRIMEEGKNKKRNDELKKLDKTNKTGLQEFFTPPEIADELIHLSYKSKESKIVVLEPSAGAGALVNALLKVNKKVIVDMVEFKNSNREILQKYAKRVPSLVSLKETKDFMEYKSGQIYDLIIANPPFNVKGYKGGTLVDMDFIIKAYNEHLKEGGEIVAIMSGYFDKPKYKKFINKVDLKILKSYRDYKWKGSDGKKIVLNFKLIRIIKKN